MLENPPLATDTRNLSRMAPLGVGLAGFHPGRFSEAQSLEIAAGMEEARQMSLTLYELEPKGAMFLTSNSINRYTIGDRTPGLARDNSGGLEIWISRGDPGAGRSANWLPAPAQGPFVLILRTYLPRAALISQRYVPPSVEKL